MIDKRSETWVTVNENLKKEIDRAQKSVMVRSLPCEETNYWRGYYAALLKIKALENPVINEVVIPDNY